MFSYVSRFPWTHCANLNLLSKMTQAVYLVLKGATAVTHSSIRAELIMIGTELLLGQTVDTNAAYIAEQLAANGINVYFKATVGDNWTRLTGVLAQALTRADIVITSGGLGPTEDDLTREVVSAVLRRPLVEDEGALAQIESWFARSNRPMPASNRKQALVPEGAHIIGNSRGTAPGFIVEHDDKIVACLPGVPHEMKAMLDNDLLPFLRQRYGLNGSLYSRNLKFYGIGESALEEQLRDLLHMTNPTVAPYASTAEVKVRLTARAGTADEAERLFAPIEQEIVRRVGEYMYGAGDDTMESVTGRALMKAGWTVALAESCTGGLIAKRLTDVPGSSAYFAGGVVAYSNDAKVRLLGVSETTLAHHGAVSAPVAEEMAVGAAQRFGATIGLSVTGIAGPGGGSEAKPVGLVFIGCASFGRVQAYRFQFSGDRDRVRTLTSQAALNIVRRHALGQTITME